VDLFHDTEAALDASWNSDKKLLEEHGFVVRQLRERPAFVEAEVAAGGDSLLLQWVRDSAYRFFPLVEHRDFGLALHPFDLATNKVLALVGRREARDWVDTIECDARLQPLGYLAWAACGKDPGFSPALILELAGRVHYSALEVSALSFAGAAPDAGELSRRWHSMLDVGMEVVRALPSEQVGKCVLAPDGHFFRGRGAAVREALENNAIHFHPGTIRGAFPQIVSK
jgi:hypothetical protein